MRRLLLITLLTFGLLGPGAEARDLTRDEYVEQIRGKISRVWELWKAGQKGEAEQLALQLDQDVNQYEAFMDGHPAYWWPDKTLAEIYFRKKDFEKVGAYAGPVIAAFDAKGERGAAEQVEIMLLLAKSLFHQERFRESELLLRQIMRDKSGDVPDKLVLDTQAFLAVAAAKSGAEDASALRREVLDGYLERDGARISDFLILWRADLAERRKVRPVDARLKQETIVLRELLQTDPRFRDVDTGSTLREIARAFVAVGDYARAAPIFEADLLLAEPDSQRYFWTLQNLLALGNFRNEYEAVLARGAEASERLVKAEHSGFARVSGEIAGSLGYASQRLGEVSASQTYYRRAYAEMRKVLPPNHPKVQIFAERIDPVYVPSSGFAYAEELGFGSAEPLEPDATGAAAVARFWDGAHVETRAQLERMKGDALYDAGFVALNLAALEAMIGDARATAAAVKEARALALSGGSKLSPDSPWFDLISAAGLLVARDKRSEDALPLLERLEARDDLTAQEARFAAFLRLPLHYNLNQSVDVRRYFKRYIAEYDPGADLSPWALTQAIFVPAFATHALSTVETKKLEEDVQAALSAAHAPELLRAMSDVLVLNNRSGSSNDEVRFQQLAYYQVTLPRGLPADHQWVAVARLLYGYGLGDRGDYEAALAMVRDASRIYRSVPWHREDAHAFMLLQQAYYLVWLNETDLGNTLIAELYNAVDRAEYGTLYWFEITRAYAESLISYGGAERGLAVLRSITEDPKARGALSAEQLAQTYWLTGWALGELGEEEAQRAMLDRALDVAPSKLFQNGAPRANLQHTVAGAFFRMGDYQKAWTTIRASNDLWFAALDADGGRDNAGNRQYARTRAIDELRIAWQLLND